MGTSGVRSIEGEIKNSENSFMRQLNLLLDNQQLILDAIKSKKIKKAYREIFACLSELKEAQQKLTNLLNQDKIDPAACSKELEKLGKFYANYVELYKRMPELPKKAVMQLIELDPGNPQVPTILNSIFRRPTDYRLQAESWKNETFNEGVETLFSTYNHALKEFEDEENVKNLENLISELNKIDPNSKESAEKYKRLTGEIEHFFRTTKLEGHKIDDILAKSQFNIHGIQLLDRILSEKLKLIEQLKADAAKYKKNVIDAKEKLKITMGALNQMESAFGKEKIDKFNALPPIVINGFKKILDKVNENELEIFLSRGKINPNEVAKDYNIRPDIVEKMVLYLPLKAKLNKISNLVAELEIVRKLSPIQRAEHYKITVEEAEEKYKELQDTVEALKGKEEEFKELQDTVRKLFYDPEVIEATGLIFEKADKNVAINMLMHMDAQTAEYTFKINFDVVQRLQQMQPDEILPAYTYCTLQEQRRESRDDIRNGESNLNTSERGFALQKGIAVALVANELHAIEDIPQEDKGSFAVLKDHAEFMRLQLALPEDIAPSSPSTRTSASASPPGSPSSSRASVDSASASPPPLPKGPPPPLKRTQKVMQIPPLEQEDRSRKELHQKIAAEAAARLNATSSRSKPEATHVPGPPILPSRPPLIRSARGLPAESPKAEPKGTEPLSPKGKPTKPKNF